jgi:anhydro-N-acetylmuramic acid kinase
MDAWIRKHRDVAFDRDGRWAGEGSADVELLERFLSEPYFGYAPPKSTGFEQFNLGWIEAHDTRSIEAGDVQATLCALSAITIADAVSDFAPDTEEILICGGGAHNPTLVNQLDTRLPGVSVTPTSVAGLDPDWVEAVAFAWLAMRNLQGLPGNLPAVTGASDAVVLGVLFDAC